MSDADRETIGVYDRDAAGYADCVAPEAEGAWPARFMSLVRPGGRILDFGCGPGWASAIFRDQGFDVTAIDGSAGLAAEAQARYGLQVEVMLFEDFEPGGQEPFDGIWASFSLLHAPRAAMPGHLERLAAALVPGGTFYLGLKEGEGEARDTLGRFYTYYGAEEVSGLLADAGLSVTEQESEIGKGFDGSPSHGLHTFARRDG